MEGGSLGGLTKLKKKPPNCKAAGPNCIKPYWWKAFFPQAAAILWEYIKGFLNCRAVTSTWFVTGQTILIPKVKSNKDPADYRPITCLNTGYKLLTASMTWVLNEAVLEKDILPPEQSHWRGGREAVCVLSGCTPWWHQMPKKARMTYWWCG